MDRKPDLLPHKYRPDTLDQFKCHSGQAQRLKQWILDFMNTSSGNKKPPSHSDYDDSSSNSDISGTIEVTNKCALLTGPPGVGKTSLVYTVAKELNLHVIESHSAEKRDFKLFSALKLANQKGKINPIAKLFQAAAQQQQTQLKNSKRKRRKLSESTSDNKPQSLSLSGDTSIVLFDDIDVVFEEDGPFLKSLVEFIRESKRPVVLTATQSIDHIKDTLIFFEHIHLQKPVIEDCIQVLKDVCKREKYHRASKTQNCQAIASTFDCDIRQCLNRIHFYGDLAGDIVDEDTKVASILPQLTKLNLENDHADNTVILDCYSISSFLDLIDSRFNFLDRSTLLQHWLDGRPSFRNEDYSFNHSLGEQIRESIVDLSKSLYSNEIMSTNDLLKQRRQFELTRQEALNLGQRINLRIKGRIEPPEREFYTDIVPMFGETVRVEAHKRASTQIGGNISRRSRRALSYLESISIYLEPEDFAIVSRTLLRIQP